MTLTLTGIFKDTGGLIVMSEDNAEKLDVIEGDIVRVVDPITGAQMAGFVMTKSIASDEVHIDQIIADAIGLNNGYSVHVEKYDQKLKPVKSITFTVESTDGTDSTTKIKQIKEFRFKLKPFLDTRIISKGYTFRFDEFNVILGVKNIVPSLGSAEFGFIDWNEIEQLDFVAAGKQKAFDGVLMIDLSRSMRKKDMFLRESAALEGLKEHFKPGEHEDFFERFTKSEPLGRAFGAGAAALLYMAEKVARGQGDKVGLVIFGGSAEIVKFGSQYWFDASTITNALDEVINIVTKIAKKGTSFVAALEKAQELIDMMNSPPDRPIMFVLLTDGNPWPEDPDDVKDFVEKLAENDPRIVLYTIGLGTSVNVKLMSEMAELTGGTFFQVRNLEELFRFYSQLAKDLTLRINLKKESAEKDSDGSDA